MWSTVGTLPWKGGPKRAIRSSGGRGLKTSAPDTLRNVAYEFHLNSRPVLKGSFGAIAPGAMVFADYPLPWVKRCRHLRSRCQRCRQGGKRTEQPADGLHRCHHRQFLRGAGALRLCSRKSVQAGRWPQLLGGLGAGACRTMEPDARRRFAPRFAQRRARPHPHRQHCDRARRGACCSTEGCPPTIPIPPIKRSICCGAS